MMPIVRYGHPALRTRGAPVGALDDSIRGLAEEMLDAMRQAQGIGLAAQQVGRPLQLAVVDVTAVRDRPSTLLVDGEESPLDLWMPLVMVDPAIELRRERDCGVEGCLSFPEITGEIVRATRVRVHTGLLDGRRVEFEAAGLLARVIQHEHDHLQGVLFVDRMSPATRAELAGRLKRMRKETERALRQGRTRE